MDKVLTKDLYGVLSVPTTPFVYFTRHEWGTHKSDLTKHIHKLGFPVFVKPARAGSSIGISRVESEEGLENAIELAFHFDSKVIVEKGVENLADLTIAVTGNSSEPETIKTSLIQESRFSDEFFTYDEKYLVEGGAQLGAARNNLIIPADIDKKTTSAIEEMARDIYIAFECSGIARVDFLYDRKEKKMYANEINPLPGTLYHHLWRDSGVSLGELLRELIRLADRLYAHKQESTYTFQTDILKQVNGGKLSRKLQ
jgi:D-alanine-D-alanine ligase